MRVTIEGIDYVPKDALFRLGQEHFDVTDRLPKDQAYESIQWAFEAQANVAEMCAWIRAMFGADAIPEPVKVEPVKPKKVVVEQGKKLF